MGISGANAGHLRRGFLLHCLPMLALVSLASCRNENPSGPKSLSLDLRERIDRVVQEAVLEEKMPGCVVAVGCRDGVRFIKAYGRRALKPFAQAMTLDTVFDLASLTKPIATATSIVILKERGILRLGNPVSAYIPEFGRKGKEGITLLHLLTHTSGLVADNPLEDYEEGRERALDRIYDLAPKAEPGAEFIYSDVGFIVLGEVVRRASGQELNVFAKENIFSPLGMKETGFKIDEPLAARAAVTEQREGRWLRGEVHDPRAHMMGGVAGHAGLFSTAADLSRFARALLGQGRLDSARILSERSIMEMTRGREIPRGLRGLGWDVLSPYSTNRGERFSPFAYGHGGYTGTCLWIDPELDLFVIFLSNRVHPDGKGEVNSLAARIGSMAAAAKYGE